MMKTLKAGQKIVIATHNQGKLKEMNDLLAPYGLRAISAGELGLEEPEENGVSFKENALIKSRAAANASGLPAFADDSGICVRALNNDPGIYSARWAGENKDFTLAMEKVNQALLEKGIDLSRPLGEDDIGEKPKREAFFVSSLALSFPDGQDENFEGTVEGHLTWPPRGANGFGYDPIFIAKGYDLTFGEMLPEEKYSLSHRTKAFALFKEKMLNDLK